jgi:sulfur carrier protein
MQIRLNGEKHSIEEGGTVETLARALGLDTQKIAIEVNLAIVPRSLYSETRLGQDDAVEIVRFIGGG